MTISGMLSGKVICITGVSSGIGRATALALSSRGANLILVGRNQDVLNRLAVSLPTKTHNIVADVRDRAALEAAFAQLPEPFKNIDGLVNNAGLALGLEPAQRASLEDWDIMVDTNIKALMAITRLILPGMVERGVGYIINIGSMAGTYPYPGANVYGATKAFVKQFSLNLRADLLGTAIRVTNIEPGMLESEFSRTRFHGDSEKADAVYQGVTPLQPEDIAETIAWCLERPAHVNINTLEVMPVAQAFAPLAVHRV